MIRFVWYPSAYSIVQEPISHLYRATKVQHPVGVQWRPHELNSPPTRLWTTSSQCTSTVPHQTPHLSMALDTSCFLGPATLPGARAEQSTPKRKGKKEAMWSTGKLRRSASFTCKVKWGSGDKNSPSLRSHLFINTWPVLGHSIFSKDIHCINEQINSWIRIKIHLERL